jgi:hypothetical protein
VFSGVVGSAVELEVFDGGFAAIGPVGYVVDVALGGGSVTAWVLAVAVSSDHGPADGWGDDSGGSSDVDWLAVGSEDDAGDGGVACDLADLFGSEDLTTDGFMGAATSAS